MSIDKDGQLKRHHPLLKGKPERFNWDTDERAINYVQRHFGGNSTASSVEKYFYLNNNGVKIERESKNCFIVHRIQYMVVSGWEGLKNWKLKYSKYGVKSIRNGVKSEITVHHCLDNVSLKKLCKDYKIDESLVKSDIWIRMITKEVITVGKNLSGNVYEAEVSGLRVVVKNYPSDHVFSDVVQKLWTTNSISSLLQPRAAQVCEQGYRIAYERCDYTLYQFVQRTTEWGRHAKDILRTVIKTLIEGIIGLHAMGICHGGINPWNILVLDGTAKIAGFKSCSFSTDPLLQEKDRIDIGRLIVFCYHQSRAWIKREEAYVDHLFKDQHALNAMYEWAGDVCQLAKLLIDKRIPLGFACGHPSLWLHDERLNFIFDADGYADKLKTAGDTSLKDHAKTNKSEYYDGNWDTKMPTRVYESPKSTYVPDCPMSLLSFMRNTLAHYIEIFDKVNDPTFKPPVLKEDNEFIGNNSVGLETSYHEKFPFLTTLHQHLMDTQNHQVLKEQTLSRFYPFL